MNLCLEHGAEPPGQQGPLLVGGGSAHAGGVAPRYPGPVRAGARVFTLLALLRSQASRTSGGSGVTTSCRMKSSAMFYSILMT